LSGTWKNSLIACALNSLAMKQREHNIDFSKSVALPTTGHPAPILGTIFEPLIEGYFRKMAFELPRSCTGGIRCENASSLMKAMGFAEVYHLKGGILQYLQDTPPEQSLWQGECFVFDERIALDHELKPKS
jgi:hypothetical protein